MPTPDYICPNCGHPAPEKYCAECGQATQLHADTFWGMLKHFVAHYFNYDSKFWITLQTLMSRPGQLTIAYREKKRQRFIPPISLYLFVSISFFLLLSLSRQYLPTSAQDSIIQTEQGVEQSPEEIAKDISNSGAMEGFIVKGVAKIQKSPEAFMERVMQSFPKMFFFMIPVLALMFNLRFKKRQDMRFGDHAVFALHMHSFIFIISLLTLINPFSSLSDILRNLVLLSGLLYFIIAIKRVYTLSWLESAFIGVFLTFIYLLLLILVLVSVLILLLSI